MVNEFFNVSVFDLDGFNWQNIVPFLVLCAGIAVNTLLASFRCSDRVIRVSSFFFFGLAALMFGSFVFDPAASFLGSALQIDATLRIVAAIICALAALSSLYISSPSYTRHSEWGALMGIAVLGLCLLPGARNWIALFVYLECFSIPAYLLCCLDSNRAKSLEAGLKYLLMGAFASAFYLLGVALLFGLTGGFSFEGSLAIFSQLSTREEIYSMFASFLILATLFFKVSIFPFHMWAADVYQGSPAPVAGFLAGATKVSVFVAIAVLLSESGMLSILLIKQMILVLAFSSIIFGSFMAVAQRRLRRMLAYSGVVNAGYMALLLPYASSGELLFFVGVYAITIAMAFASVEAISRSLGNFPSEDLEISSLVEAKGRVPVPLLLMLGFVMFSLAGIPPFPGFFSKYLLLSSVASNGAYWSLAVVLLGTFLGLAYYLRSLVPVFLFEKVEAVKVGSIALAGKPAFVAVLALALSVIVVVFFGPLIEIIRTADLLAR